MKKIMFEKIAPFIIGATLLVGCSSVAEQLNDKELVLTSPAYVATGDELVSVRVNDLPKALTESLPEELQNEEFVVVEKEALDGEDVPYIPLLAGSEAWEAALDDPDVSAGIFDTLMAILLAFFPSLAAWEGLLIVMFRRKRQHWINFVKHLIPWGSGDKGDVNVAEALGDVLKAMGGAHSSEATEILFEEELAEEIEE